LASVSVGLFCHSYQPSAGTRQRRATTARRNAGFSKSDSARALIMRAPPVRSFDQDGTSPQVSPRRYRTAAGLAGASPSASAASSAASSDDRGIRSRTTGCTVVGAMLKLASPGVRAGYFGSSAPSSFASLALAVAGTVTSRPGPSPLRKSISNASTRSSGLRLDA
jgi:hypothetical protein